MHQDLFKQRLPDSFYKFNGDFWAFNPIEYKDEEPGLSDWKGGTLDYVASKSHFHMEPLDAVLEKILKHPWASAKPGTSSMPPQPSPGPAPTYSGTSHPPNILGAARQPPPGAPMPSNPGVYNPVPVIRGSTFASQSAQAPHLKAGYAQDWAFMNEIPRVRAYAFRGERVYVYQATGEMKRTPEDIEKTKGFFPPNARTDAYYMDNTVFPQFRAYLQDKYHTTITKADFDKALTTTALSPANKTALMYYARWSEIARHEAYHIGRMVADPAEKGFISTTRATPVAKGFAKAGGWVYLLYLNGGYLLPDKGTHAWTQGFSEQEIAMPCEILWENVCGFRLVGPNCMFQGPVYMRPKSPIAEDDDAMLECYYLLSGKKQGGKKKR